MANKNLTQEQIEKFKEAFSQFDKNGDGKITKAEFTTVMESFGQKTTTAEIEYLIKEFDTNGDGTISFTEFLTMMVQDRAKCFDDETEMQKAFCVMDKDGDGFLSKDELRHMMINLGEKSTEEEIDDMIREFDADGDGRINFEEFMKIFKSE